MFYFPGKSFTELARQLLNEGHSQILSEHLVCQDALEQYFGRQRDSVGGNCNPSMKEFLNNSLIFSVVKQAKSSTTRNGNTTASRQEWEIDDSPLPRKRKNREEWQCYKSHQGVSNSLITCCNQPFKFKIYVFHCNLAYYYHFISISIMAHKPISNKWVYYHDRKI